MRTWSHYQEAIFSAIENPDGGSIVVNAVAGSGKSTTLVEGAHRAPIRGRMAIVAFAQRSKARVEDADPPRHFDVSTLHSMGLALLRKHNPNLQVDREGAKLRELCDEEFPRDWPKRQLLFPLVKAAKTRLVNNPRDLTTLAIAIDELGATQTKADVDEVVAATERVLFMCRERDDLIDFDDMIWLPVELGLSEARYRWLLVDELQDMTRAQVALVASVSKGGRVVGYGDRSQNIYFFAGASEDACGDLVAFTKAVEMPLSISYRCPRAVIEEAKKYVPEIEARPAAPDGKLVEGSSLRTVKPGDLIISRSNAPLLKQCLEFVRAGVPAYVAGKSHGDSMVKLIAKSKSATVRSFLVWLGHWAKGEMQKLESAGKPIEGVADRVECFQVVADGAPSIDEMTKRIESLFVERRGSAIVLSTVHQMKGDEFDRVFVLDDTFRLSRDKFESEPEYYRGREEANLRYVSVTRAKKELHYVGGVK